MQVKNLNKACIFKSLQTVVCYGRLLWTKIHHGCCMHFTIIGRRKPRWLDHCGSVIVDRSSRIDRRKSIILDRSSWINCRKLIITDRSSQIDHCGSIVVNRLSWIDHRGSIVAGHCGAESHSTHTQNNHCIREYSQQYKIIQILEYKYV